MDGLAPKFYCLVQNNFVGKFRLKYGAKYRYVRKRLKIITFVKRFNVYCPQTKLWKGNVFHKRMSRILSTGGGGEVYTP